MNRSNYGIRILEPENVSIKRGTEGFRILGVRSSTRYFFTFLRKFDKNLLFILKIFLNIRSKLDNIITYRPRKA